MNEENSEKPEDLTLRSYRESLDLSREELSRRLELSARTIEDWERGRKLPRLDNAVLLAKELGLSMKELCRSMSLDVSSLQDD
jgi:transcriptional regulator with XRE-family HTH domain